MSPEQLIAWRKRLGLTAKAAAEQLGLSINGYAAYERGYVFKGGGISYYEREFATNIGVKTAQVPRPIPKHVELACSELERRASIQRSADAYHD